MGRTSRVSYHQNVFDLLDHQPAECPTALAAIRETEERIGRSLPASVRDWYGRAGVVPAGRPVGQWGVPEDFPCFPLPGPEERTPPSPTEDLWYNYVGNWESNFSSPDSLTALLAQIDGRVDIGPGRRGRVARVVVESYDLNSWWIDWTASDDPRVLLDSGESPDDWDVAFPTFSDLVFGTIAWGYLAENTPIACEGHWNQWTGRPDPEEDFGDEDFEDEEGAGDGGGRPPAPPKLYKNGLWLRAPDEPFAPPVLDALSDQLGEPERIARPGNVTTYVFRPEGATLRITADEVGLEGGLSAWSAHAESADGLARLGRLLLPWGTLHQTLRAETEEGKAVLASLRG